MRQFTSAGRPAGLSEPVFRPLKLRPRWYWTDSVVARSLFLSLFFLAPPLRFSSRPSDSGKPKPADTIEVCSYRVSSFFHRLDIHPHGLHRKSTSSNEIRFLICSMFRSNSRIDRLVHSFFEIHTLLLLTSCCSE